jgi:hypothetical protein
MTAGVVKERLEMDTQLASTTGTTFGRLAGAAGVAFAAIVAFENLALPSAPDFDASGEEVLRWVHDHHALVASVVASFAVTTVCLATFVGGFVARALRDDRSEVRTLALVGAFGATLIGAWFTLVIISQLMLLALDGSATATPATVELVWHLHGAAFVINVVAIGVACFGVGGAAARMGLAPSWYGPLSIVALLLAVATAAEASWALNGGAGWQIGFVPFLTWLVLLAITGVRMARTPA